MPSPTTIERLTQAAKLFRMQKSAELPLSPLIDGVVEGPFVGYRSIANGATAAVDLLAKNGPFGADPKLAISGFNASGADHPAGVFWLRSIRAISSSSDNLDTQLQKLQGGWSIQHTPANRNRLRSVPMSLWNRFAYPHAVAVGPLERVGGDRLQKPYVFEGGGWLVDTLADTLQIAKISVVGSATLATTIEQVIIVDGYFIPGASI